MAHLSKYASRGGIVLSAASLGLACKEIRKTDNVIEKNEILFESAGGFGGGLIYGAGVTFAVAMMATPVGWVAALALAAGGVAFSTISGYGAKYWYNTRGKQIAYTKITRASQLCK